MAVHAGCEQVRRGAQLWLRLSPRTVPRAAETVLLQPQHLQRSLVATVACSLPQ